MHPRFKEGELFFVHLTRPLTHGCDVVVELHPEPDAVGGEAFIRQYLGHDDDVMTLRQQNPRRVVSMPLGQIKSALRILTTEDLMGL